MEAFEHVAKVFLESQGFPSETFRVLKEKELAKFGEYHTRRLVMEGWGRLQKV